MVKRGRAEPADSSNLRKSAEELLSMHISDLEAPSPEEVEQLVYELEVHRIELEMQNEELREAQQELEASRDRYADLYDFAPLGYVSLDKHGRIQEINLTAAKLLGRERATVTGRPFVSYVAMEDKNTFMHHVRKCVEGQQQVTSEIDIAAKGGQSIPVQLDSIAARDPTSGVTLCRTAITDITEREQAAAAVREARILAEAIVETVREPLLVLNAGLRVQSANRSFYKTFQVTPQETQNRLVYELGDHQWDIPQLRDLLEEVLPKKSQFTDFEVQHYFQHIGQRTMLLNAREILHESGHPGLILLAIEDITERRRADDLLAHLDSVPQENPNPVVETDLAGNVTYLNPAAQAQLPDLVALGPRHPFLDGLIPLIAALEKQETDSFVREVDLGNVIYEQKISHASQNNLIRIFANDITKRKQAYKELNRSAAELQHYNQELERSNRELQDFAYIVSHDLRAPLVNIQGFSRELALSCERLRSVAANVQVPEAERRELSTLLDEDIPEALEFITTSTTKMDSLLSGVLQLSRVGRATLTIRQLDMNQMLSEIVTSMQFAIDEAGASVQVDSLPPCQGDQMQINQVLSNLLSNALKYLDPNRPGVIRVCGREEPHRAVYSIEDNGIGIAAEHQDSIYKIFHRLDPRRGTGEGLGLTIVRRVLDRHRGKIWVESEVNEGSKFYVSLPKG